MSYCRFSSDGFTSDAYVYESVMGGYAVHFAKKKRVFSEEFPELSIKDDAETFKEKIEAQKLALKTSKMESIENKYAGKSFNISSLKELYWLLQDAEKHGMRIPKTCLQIISEEMEEEMNKFYVEKKLKEFKNSLTETKVIQLIGKKGAGKTETQKVLKTILEEAGLKVATLNFADPMKSLACASLQISIETLEKLKREEETGLIVTTDGGKTTMRKFLQNLGETAKGIFNDQNIWVKAALERIKWFESQDVDVVIIGDTRFENEITEVGNLYQQSVIKVKRNVASSDTHKSEQLEYKTNVEVDNNNSLESLQETVFNLIPLILKDIKGS